MDNNIKKLFCGFLKANNAYISWKKYSTQNFKFEFVNNFFNCKPEDLLESYFSWETTKEGQKFWRNLDRKWKILYMKKIENKLVFINEKDRDIFPFEEYQIFIKDEKFQPKLHLRKNETEITFLIKSGRAVDGENFEDHVTYDYAYLHINRWLNTKCVTSPNITNRENAMNVWNQLHSKNK